MTTSAQPTFDDAVAPWTARVGEAVREYGLSSATAVFLEPISADEITAILAAPGIESIVVPPESATVHAGDPRVGVYDRPSVVWTLPERLGVQLVIGCVPSAVPRRLCLQLMRRRIWRIWFWVSGFWRPVSVAELLIRQSFGWEPKPPRYRDSHLDLTGVNAKAYAYELASNLQDTATIVLNGEITDAEAREFRGNTKIVSVLCSGPTRLIEASEGFLGHRDFGEAKRLRPAAIGRNLIFVAQTPLLSFRTHLAIGSGGAKRLYALSAYGWRRYSHFSALCDRLLSEVWSSDVAVSTYLRFQSLFLVPQSVMRLLELSSLSLRLHDLFGLGDARRSTYEDVLAKLDDRMSGDPAEAGKVVLITGSLGVGGSERQFLLTAKGLRKKLGAPPAILLEGELEQADTYNFDLPDGGTSIQFIAAYADDYLFERFCLMISGFGVDALRLPHERGRWVRIAQYWEYFRRERPEVAHIWMESSTVFAGLAALLAGVPKIVLSPRSLSAPNFPIFDRSFRPIYQVLLKSDRVVVTVNSKAGAESYGRWLCVDPSRFVVNHNGIDLETFNRGERDKSLRNSLGIPVDAPVIGGLIRLVPVKRPKLWLAVAREVRRQMPDAHFVLAGGGEMGRAMTASAVKEGWSDRLHLLGSTADPTRALSIFDVTLMTSRIEGLPNALLESQAMGVPVVASNVGGIGETFIDGVTGHLIKSNRAEDFAVKIVEILRDKGWQANARKVAAEWACKNFSADAMIARTLAAYDMKSSGGATQHGPNEG